MVLVISKKWSTWIYSACLLSIVACGKTQSSVKTEKEKNTEINKALNKIECGSFDKMEIGPISHCYKFSISKSYEDVYTVSNIRYHDKDRENDTFLISRSNEENIFNQLEKVFNPGCTLYAHYTEDKKSGLPVHATFYQGDKMIKWMNSPYFFDQDRSKDFKTSPMYQIEAYVRSLLKAKYHSDENPK